MYSMMTAAFKTNTPCGGLEDSVDAMLNDNYEGNKTVAVVTGPTVKPNLRTVYPTKDGQEATFTKGHRRRGSGHFFVSGEGSGNEGVSSAEVEEATADLENSNEESLEKNEKGNSFEDDKNSPIVETSKIFPEHYVLCYDIVTHYPNSDHIGHNCSGENATLDGEFIYKRSLRDIDPKCKGNELKTMATIKTNTSCGGLEESVDAMFFDIDKGNQNVAVVTDPTVNPNLRTANPTKDGQEATYTKGHRRRGSGYIFVLGEGSDNEGVSSGEVGEATADLENSDEESLKKNENGNSFEDDKHSPIMETYTIVPEHNVLSCVKGIHCPNSDQKGHNSSSEHATAPGGEFVYRRSIQDIDPECKGTTFVSFAEPIRDCMPDLVRAEFDVMDLCDYLYQFRIMDKTTYEFFFEMSHFTSNSAIKYLKRRLMLFLSKTLPRDTLENAVTEADCHHVFVNVFSNVGLKGSQMRQN